MAKAELQYKTHTRQVRRTVVETEEVQKVSGITLTLTKREARTLRTVCRHIGGLPNESLRGVTDTIEAALRAAGVGYFCAGVFNYEVRRGSLYFTEHSLQAEVRDENLGEVISGSVTRVDPQPSLKVGDKVRIVRKVESYSDGWVNSWAEQMDPYVNNGKVYTIRNIHFTGVYFSDDAAHDYGWPEAALEKVTEEKPKLREGVRIRATATSAGLYHKGDTGTLLHLEPDHVHEVRWDHKDKSSYALEENLEVIGKESPEAALEKVTEVTLPDGAPKRIRITAPWEALGYNKGDVLRVIRYLGVNGGVEAYNPSGKEVFVAAREFTPVY